MKPSIREKLDQLSERLEDIDRLLSSEDAARDMERFRKLSRERSELEPVVARFAEYRQAETDIRDAEAMLADPDMRAFAEEEITAARARLPQLDVELQTLLLPRDPNDEKNVILEIRAGT
ncbi:MAG TPA: PCRF domain-containing protein, partial [Rhodocyclaceae bacterium]|nr:PCRF domain-containing protein [Rhodocyclaceae bacterium]